MAHVQLTCEICEAAFFVKPYRAIPGPRRARFCSGRCRGKWLVTLPHIQAAHRAPKPHMRGNKLRQGLAPTNSFAAGHVPWNRDLKGIHLSPASEFKSGPRPEKRAEIGEERLRADKHGGQRMWVKVAHPNVWRLRAVVVWEAANGQVPNGKLLHHHDHDKLNDALENLRCITRAEHIEEHRSEIRAARWG